MPATTTIVVPACTVEVLDAPVSLREAFTARDQATGRFFATVKVPVVELARFDLDYDEFYASLSDRVVSDIYGFNISYTVLAVAPGGDLLVEVSLDIVAEVMELADRGELAKAGISAADADFAYAQMLERSSWPHGQ